jgi:hypothetical protein
MKEYLVDEFIDNAEEYELAEQVDKKVSLLYDLCKLRKRKKTSDNRENAVRALLASYKSEVQMDNAVHNIIMGNETLNDLLKRKGFLQ